MPLLPAISITALSHRLMSRCRLAFTCQFRWHDAVLFSSSIFRADAAATPLMPPYFISLSHRFRHCHFRRW
jgi:hypothetical protein